MWYVVGLGNPGEEYENTRHNAGRILLEAFARHIGAGDFAFDKKINARVAEGKVKPQGKARGREEKVMLVAPETFMNKSGLALKTLVSGEKKALRLIVIHDDFNFPAGKFRISFNRSSGGHNGVESVIKNIKTEAFIRIRAGISPANPKGLPRLPRGAPEVEKLILGEFKKTELEALKKASKRVAQAIETIITEGREKAMTEFNKD